MELKKGINVSGKKIDHVVPYKVYYNKQTKQVQGQAPYFMVVADIDKKLPDMIAKPKEIEERQVALVIFEKE